MNKLKRWLTGLLLGFVALSAVAEGPAAWTYSAKPWSQWVLGAQLKPTFNLNLAAIAAGNYDPLTLTRASSGTMFDSTGTLVTKSTNVARVDYDPATLVLRGLLIEEARTNSIRNNTGQGVVAGAIGSGGDPGTQWTVSINTTTGLTRTVVGTSTESGITYTDLRISGTASGAGSVDFFFEQANGVAALTAQTWTLSTYWKLQAGSWTGMSGPTLGLYEYTSAPAFITAQSNGYTLPSGSGLSTQRIASTITTNGGATTAFIRPILKINIANGAAVDFTLRIGMPQLELGAFATSVIPTSTVAVTRAADIASITGANFTSFWNATQGTFVARYALVETANGGNQFVMRASNNTYNNQIGAINTISTGFPQISTTSGGVFDGAAAASVALVDNVFSTVASSYSAAGISISKDGAAVVTDASITFPTGMTRLDIGGDHTGANHFGSGWISNLTYYPTAVDAVTLTQLASDTMPTFAANDDVFWLTASAR